ncbi:DNA-directed RNA polymerase subunit delta [Paenibacillus polymyxa]|uniref:DNA-directed RNA polymerase subunit delta n=3 Tax=Paenibacillus TaxID=44249 RepID=A0ACC4ZUH0_9BACL|nr:MULTISPECIES: DNA-directed RNA polymerase subunit delta [Paenibacillus]MBU9709921.1 DNA-directed RNA polymerase subunit delta [Paenibacillus sp. AK121]MCV9952469.1 DNA-directed RNA polymerase subunit delta [Paenibacillus sp. BT-177]ADO54125.1 DNA-directed RNA polymerase subunit delta [Paenibacillus polymyxa SC2]AJE51525.1 DNA-directed RNA polymerase subunit delta [Paenibacillus polymyxa]AUO06297.1 DNA-directed RNA polymerase subunit delta [Paenibacillus sp. lzh-N1]
MSTPLNLKIDPEKVHETPMVDLAFMVLKAANTPYYYRDLMNEVAKLRGLSDEEINDVIAQLYTEINIDGRFACVGTNLWGLKRWYPVDKSEDALTGAKRPRIINDEDDDDEDDYHEEEETYNSDDDFDADSEDEDGEDELFDGEDDDDSDDDVVIDDEDLSDEEDTDDENDDESIEDDDDSLR